MRTLSPREARLIAILLLVAAIALVQFVVIAPIASGFTDRAQAREELLARYAANARSAAAIPRLTRAAAARDREVAIYELVAPNATAAADQLRERMQAAATASGAEFRGGDDVTAPPGIAQTRVVFRVPNGGLPRLLAQIENGKPLVRITALTVNADEALVAGTAANLDVTLEVAIAFRPAAAR